MFPLEIYRSVIMKNFFQANLNRVDFALLPLNCTVSNLIFPGLPKFIGGLLGPWWWWSSGQHSTLTIRVRIPLKPTVFCVTFGFERNKHKQKEVCVGPFKNKNCWGTLQIYLKQGSNGTLARSIKHEVFHACLKRISLLRKTQ